MKLLVIGGGGREHALAWRLARSARVQTIFIAPGNGGRRATSAFRMFRTKATKRWRTLRSTKMWRLPSSVPKLRSPPAWSTFSFARIEDLRPTRAAAQLESSKDFAKAFMQRHRIPTAQHQTFTDAALARAYVNERGAPIVIKADGLAAGKGVVVAMTVDEANAAIDSMLIDNRIGASGSRVVIEEFLTGEEASFIVMSDGKNVLALATSQDHKRLLDDDRGPNTGGMGAYSPAPVITPTIHARVLREIIMPTVNGMAADGIPYQGFLYAGLMIDPMAGSRRSNSIAAWAIPKLNRSC